MRLPFSFWANIKNATIPILTGNTSSPVGIASASSISSSTFDAWKAFDGNDATFWSPAGSSPGEWLQFQFNIGKTIKKYSVLLFATKSWVFAGSNDGVIFTLLDSQISQSNITKNIPNDIKYLYYRMTFSDPSIAARTVQFYGF